MAEILSKAEFAARRGVHPSAISRWIKAGRLTKTALSGHGRGARIVVEEAERQLEENLDPGQQLAQATLRTPAGTAGLEEGGSHTERYAKARADTAEMEAVRSRRRLQAENGTYMLTQAATTAWSKEMADLLQGIEQWFPDLNRKVLALVEDTIASGRALDEKRLTIETNRAWREFRTLRAELARSAAASMPALIQDDTAA